MSLWAALRGVRGERVPIWIMRQAGRYLPEYRALKARHSFVELLRTPELAAEVTLQPLRRFPLDAAIVFSDIMTPLEALGVEVDFSPGPVIRRPLRSHEEIDALALQAPVAPFVGETLALVRSQLAPEIALIGFCGAPLSLAAYLVEGGGSKEFEHFRALLRTRPQAMHRLLETLTELSIAYLHMQIASGADAIQIFDSSAGLHDRATYREFGLPYNQRIVTAVAGRAGGCIFYALGAAHLLDELAEIPAQAIGLDWRTDLSQARRRLGGRTLQGNLDPAVLYADAATIRREARRVLDSGAQGPHIFNLGHGIWPTTPIEAVSELVDCVRSYKA